MIKGFISFEKKIRTFLEVVVQDHELHGLWLNTLSYLENCGARKIAACEHPTAVKEEMLKHAAEEFRHALYLKQQLTRIGQVYPDYHRSCLLGQGAYRYLDALDLHVSRYLRGLGMTLLQIKEHAYLLVTYAIELRAGELYPLYHTALRAVGSTVQVKSILLEEKEHLQDMETQLSHIANTPTYVEVTCQIEAQLFEKWLKVCCLQANQHSCKHVLV